MKARIFMIINLGIFASHLEGSAATLTWTGTNSSDFYNATNWLPMAVPASEDTLNITNGHVDISPAFTSSGSMNWSGGSLSGAIIISNVMAMSGPATKLLAAAITNYGTLTLSGVGRLSYGQTNAVLVNQAGALLDLQGDILITNAARLTGPQVINAGTFRKSAGNKACIITGITFQNMGTLSALSGTLSLQGGGMLGGVWTASAGASLTFSVGRFSLLESAVSSGPGFIGVTNDSLSPPFSGGASFSGALGTTMGWSGGTIGSGQSGWTLATNGVLAISGANPKYLYEWLTNNGTITLSGTGLLQYVTTSQAIANQAGALFDIQGDELITGPPHPGSQMFNAGTFRKSAGTNTCKIALIAFENTGTISTLSGTLDLRGGGTLGGNWEVSNDAALTFSDQAFALLETAVSSGSGFVGVARGSPSFTGTLGTTMSWSGGTIGSGQSGWTLASNGVLAISGANPKYLNESVTNNGTIGLAGPGNLYCDQDNLVIVNQAGALFDVQGDVTITNGVGSAGAQIVNAGTFRKSAGTNACSIGGITFQNIGTWAALSGTIAYDSSFTNSAGTLAVSVGGPSTRGQFAFSRSLGLGGTLQVTFADNSSPAAGNQFQLISSRALIGSFATLDLPQSTSLVTTTNAVYLLVTGAAPPELLNAAYSGGHFEFSISTVNGQSYTVQRSDDLATSNWVPYTNFTGDGSIIRIVAPVGGVPQRFFRVREP
jgi:hypothetical protein